MATLSAMVALEKLKIPTGMKRSGEWPKARAEHLKSNPACIVCGNTEHVEVHHIEPFHLHLEKELDPTNFATLCECDKVGLNCHLAFGHLGNYKSWNVDVLKDAAFWSVKIKTRPTVEV